MDGAWSKYRVQKENVHNFSREMSAWKIEKMGG